MYDSTIARKLVDCTFKQEINRIKAVKARKYIVELKKKTKNKKRIERIVEELRNRLDNTNLDNDTRKRYKQRLDLLTLDENTLISNFDKNGDKFYFLDFLNDEMNNDTLVGELVKKYIDGKLEIKEVEHEGVTYNSELEMLQALVEKAIIDNLDKKFQEFKQSLVENGAIKEKVDYLKDGTRIDEITPITPLLSAAIAGIKDLREFFFNDFFAQVNIMQLTITDLAFYKNVEDLQKRLAQLHAPSLKPNTNATINGERVSDGTFRTVYIKDAVVMSDVWNDLKKATEKILSLYPKDSVIQGQVKTRLNNILEQFKSVNWADAQGYTCPTAYRKRMAMFGKWDAKQEDAYQNLINTIKEGKPFKATDLDILWQPLKPFGYSQIKVDGHNPYMPNIKMGVQNKNSEYLLIMADAIMRGADQGNNKLSALFDIMEESYKKAGMDKGIDAIQFESTVKTGKRSVIDINSIESAEDIKDVFNKILYKDGQYNTDYIQEYDFQDYGIQQEVPAHFESSQQHGSQVRILAISDIMAKDAQGKDRMITVNGKNMTVTEARNMYLSAVDRNINRSIDEIKQRFKLGSLNPKIANRAISKLLTEQILKDGKYGVDMLNAVQVDGNGNFNIPLSDPIHSDRIQMLLNSVIKNTVWKQKIAGGPVVQVSSFGLSEDLHIICNEDGTPKWFEAYVPIYDKNIIKDFMKEDGTIDIEAMEKVNPKLLQMFGYRIPTESKYSMVPIKVKGFLPRNAGEGIMLPKEITTLSGSGFDLNKLYLMRYEFDRNEFYKYYQLKTLQDIIWHYAVELYTTRQIKKHLAGEELIDNETVSEILSTAKTIIKPTVEYTEPKSRRAADNNTIIDCSLAFLTSQYALEQFTTPGGFEDLKHIGYSIEAYKNHKKAGGTESYDSISKKSVDELKDMAHKNQNLLYAHTQVAFHRQNMVAGKLIGVFAQANVSHAYISTWADMGHVCSIKIPDFASFRLNDREFSGEVYIDREYENNNTGLVRISMNLAQYLAASVDAVKDPILNLMNISMETVSVATTLIRMGVSMETVALLLSHPAVVEAAIAGDLAYGGEGLNEKIRELEENGITPSDNFVITDDFLKRQLVRDSSEEGTSADDLAVLKTIRNILRLGQRFLEIGAITRHNSIKNGVGPFMSDTAIKRGKIKKFLENDEFSEDLREIIDPEKGMPILKTIINNCYAMESMIFNRDRFVQSNLANTLSILQDRIGYMTPKLAKKFYDFSLSWALCQDGRSIFDMSDAHRNEILNEFPDQFHEEKQNHPDNKLIRAIKVITDSKGNQRLILRSRGYSSDQMEEMRIAWADLWEEDEKLARKLIEYNFFRGSFSFSPTTFMHLLPNAIKRKLINDTNGGSYIGNIAEGVQPSARMVDQFMVLNHLVDAKVSSLQGLSEYQDKAGESGHFLVRVQSSSINEIFYVSKDRIKQLSRLGYRNQGFEIDPSREVYDIKSVVKNGSKNDPKISLPDDTKLIEALDYFNQYLNEKNENDENYTLSPVTIQGLVGEKTYSMFDEDQHQALLRLIQIYLTTPEIKNALSKKLSIKTTALTKIKKRIEAFLKEENFDITEINNEIKYLC